MGIGIGVVGTGSMGSDHVRRLASQVFGAEVRALFDVDPARAGALALAVGAKAHASAQQVIEDSSVEALLIASPGETHAELVLACIAAGKPVLCEKPLAPTAAEARKILDAEVAHGRRLVQVGFMRRYDPGYLAVKQALDDGRVGEVLLLHCLHRNPTSPPFFTSEMLMTDSAIHEIDVARWLLGEELTATTVIAVRRSPLAPEQLRDPQLVLLEAASGVLVEVEIFVNCQYGYDVRCEVVGASGTASLDTPSTGAVALAGVRGQAIAADWRTRFGDAYRAELQDWTDGLRLGEVRGPTAWDGYAATAVAESCVRSLRSGARTEVSLTERPALYA